MATSDLVLSNDINNLTKYDMDTYTNKELIDIDQYINDEPPYAGYKLKGIEADEWFIFGKPLYDNNSFVVVFFNGMNESMDIICDQLCFLSMVFKQKDIESLTVSDLYQHEVIGSVERTGMADENVNGILEMGMCVASKDQKWKFDQLQGSGIEYLIVSEMNDGYLGTYDCNVTKNMDDGPILVTSKKRMIDNECNGDNQVWIVSNVSNSDGVQICNKNYMEKGDTKNTCLYYDTIKGTNYAYSYFEQDSTIREMAYCNKKNETVLPLYYNDFCRCLQIRPFVGSSLFSYIAKNVEPNGGSVAVKFTVKQ